MSGFRFRLVAAGSELGFVSYAVPDVRIGDTVHLPDGTGATVLEVWEDGGGQAGDAQATIVVDAGSQ